MKIAIVSINYHSDLTGISVYTTGLAESLVQDGDKVDVYTAFPLLSAMAEIRLRPHPGNRRLNKPSNSPTPPSVLPLPVPSP